MLLWFWPSCFNLKRSLEEIANDKLNPTREFNFRTFQCWHTCCWLILRGNVCILILTRIGNISLQPIIVRTVSICSRNNPASSLYPTDKDTLEKNLHQNIYTKTWVTKIWLIREYTLWLDGQRLCAPKNVCASFRRFVGYFQQLIFVMPMRYIIHTDDRCTKELNNNRLYCLSNRHPNIQPHERHMIC